MAMVAPGHWWYGTPMSTVQNLAQYESDQRLQQGGGAWKGTARDKPKKRSAMDRLGETFEEHKKITDQIMAELNGQQERLKGLLEFARTPEQISAINARLWELGGMKIKALQEAKKDYPGFKERAATLKALGAAGGGGSGGKGGIPGGYVAGLKFLAPQQMGYQVPTAQQLMTPANLGRRYQPNPHDVSREQVMRRAAEEAGRDDRAEARLASPPAPPTSIPLAGARMHPGMSMLDPGGPIPAGGTSAPAAASLGTGTGPGYVDGRYYGRDVVGREPGMQLSPGETMAGLTPEQAVEQRREQIESSRAFQDDLDQREAGAKATRLNELFASNQRNAALGPGAQYATAGGFQPMPNRPLNSLGPPQMPIEPAPYSPAPAEYSPMGSPRSEPQPQQPQPQQQPQQQPYVPDMRPTADMPRDVQVDQFNLPPLSAGIGPIGPKPVPLEEMMEQRRLSDNRGPSPTFTPSFVATPEEMQTLPGQRQKPLDGATVDSELAAMGIFPSHPAYRGVKAKLLGIDESELPERPLEPIPVSNKVVEPASLPDPNSPHAVRPENRFNWFNPYTWPGYTGQTYFPPGG